MSSAEANLVAEAIHATCHPCSIRNGGASEVAAALQANGALYLGSLLELDGPADMSTDQGRVSARQVWASTTNTCLKNPSLQAIYASAHALPIAPDHPISWQLLTLTHSVHQAPQRRGRLKSACT